MILDKYFAKPLFWDYLIGFSLLSIIIFCYKHQLIPLPSREDSYALTGDYTNISLTFAGFILTILTVLITFKDSSTNSNDKEEPGFHTFFKSKFYFQTVTYLKDCIKSIILVASLGFFLRLFLHGDARSYLFFFNCFGLTITILTILRCLLIVSKVLDMQK